MYKRTRICFLCESGGEAELRAIFERFSILDASGVKSAFYSRGTRIRNYFRAPLRRRKYELARNHSPASIPPFCSLPTREHVYTRHGGGGGTGGIWRVSVGCHLRTVKKACKLRRDTKRPLISVHIYTHTHTHA